MDATVVDVTLSARLDGGMESIPNVLQTWAAARGLRLALPAPGGRHTIAVDPAVATRVEEQLHSARELLTQHDTDGAERALARAEQTLLAHPELPQAAWLLAEVERGWAARFARLDPADPARAERHWRAAAALDGGRTAGVGEPTIVGAPESAPFTLDVSGGERADIRLDGEPIAHGDHTAGPGVHQLVAKVSGEVVFAQWVTVTRGGAVHVALPTAEPCSRSDVTSAVVRCPSWVSVRAGDRANTFVVRTCAGAECGPEIIVAPWTAIPGDAIAAHHGLPKWAVWTLIGTGVVAAGVAAGIAGWFALPPTYIDRFVTTKPQ